MSTRLALRFGALATGLMMALGHSSPALSAQVCRDLFLSQADATKSAKLISGPLRSAPKVIIFSAPSGAGKSTLMNLLTSEFADSFVFSVSTTTRAPRGAEKNGVEYHFTTVADFEARIQNGEFIEYANVHGNYYGTSRADIERAMKSGKSIILDIDVKGADIVRKAMPGQVLSVFISPPDLKILEQRLRGRGTDSDEAIQKRMRNAIEEMNHQGSYDTVIVNNVLDDAYLALKQFLTDPKSKSPKSQLKQIDITP